MGKDDTEKEGVSDIVRALAAAEPMELDPSGLRCAICKSSPCQQLCVYRRAVEWVAKNKVAPPSTYLTITYPKSQLRQALDLIGPAQDEQHFQARLHIAQLMVLAILRSHDNRIIRRDPVTKQLDTREIEAALAEACAGTEFTAKVLQPDNATRLVVDLGPKRFGDAAWNEIMNEKLGVGGGQVMPTQRWHSSDLGPKYTHDCDQCTPLGSFTVDNHTSDLYFCAKSVPTVIARYGNAGQDYESGLGINSPPLVEAERRARERGLL